jgi:EmrB/QacA subfamily drug resistance transporter
VLGAALWGLFAVGFSITVLTVSIPAIARDLDASEGVLIWVITGPMLLAAVITPAAGKLSDLLGARRVYLWSMVFVAVLAALSAAAWSAWSLIAFRVLGAAVGSATGPASLSIINKLFARHERAKALGYWSLVAAGGPVLGVVVGGPIVEASGWRWIFIGQVPLTLLTVVVCAMIFPDTERVRGTRFDLPGAVLLATGVGGVLVAVNRGPALGWSSTPVVGGFVLGVALLVAFVVVERRSPNPLIPLEYFRRRNFTFGMANQFSANFAYMGGFYLTPFLMQHVLGYSASKTGVVSVARPLAFAIAGPVSGALAVRLGERRNAVTGGLLLVGSMLVFTMIGTTSGVGLIIVALALSGVGMGTLAPAMSAVIANSVDERDLGVVGAAQLMASQVGVVAGIQLLVTIQQAREGAVGAVTSYHNAYFAGALVAAMAVVFASFVRSTKAEDRVPLEVIESLEVEIAHP